MNEASWYLIATLFAIAAGPLSAVLVTRYLNNYSAQKERRLGVFRNLMQTRGLKIDPLHVGALNLIEVEFYGKQSVIDAFGKYIEHLSKPLPPEIEQDFFFNERDNLFSVLLSKIGAEVGIRYDRKDLENRAYAPQGWEKDQLLQRRNQTLINQLLEGKRPLPVSPHSAAPGGSPFPPAPELD